MEINLLNIEVNCSATIYFPNTWTFYEMISFLADRYEVWGFLILQPQHIAVGLI